MSKRLLIAIGDALLEPDQLPPGIRELIDGADEILVISPRLPTRLEWLVSDTDKARQEADERLRRALGQLQETEADVEGAIGADDPILAFEDAVARFSPAHVLIALRSEDRAGWQESKLDDQLRERINVPITMFDLPDLTG